jgi:starch synthase
MAVKFSDGVILGDDSVDAAIIDYAKSLNIPVLDYQGEDYKEAYSSFYESIMD